VVTILLGPARAVAAANRQRAAQASPAAEPPVPRTEAGIPVEAVVPEP
jgi:hypothetical protein